MSKPRTPAQTEALARGRSLGGLAVGKLTPPDVCPRCGRSYQGKSWYAWLGHKGLHTLADRHFGGDIQAAQAHLRANGIARQDPVPANGAFPRYKPLTTK